MKQIINNSCIQKNWSLRNNIGYKLNINLPKLSNVFHKRAMHGRVMFFTKELCMGGYCVEATVSPVIYVYVSLNSWLNVQIQFFQIFILY
jgi:hypothetical protein